MTKMALKSVIENQFKPFTYEGKEYSLEWDFIDRAPTYLGTTRTVAGRGYAVTFGPYFYEEAPEDQQLLEQWCNYTQTKAKQALNSQHNFFTSDDYLKIKNKIILPIIVEATRKYNDLIIDMDVAQKPNQMIIMENKMRKKCHLLHALHKDVTGIILNVLEENPSLSSDKLSKEIGNRINEKINLLLQNPDFNQYRDIFNGILRGVSGIILATCTFPLLVIPSYARTISVFFKPSSVATLHGIQSDFPVLGAPEVKNDAQKVQP